jgi:hypothetical protein
VHQRGRLELAKNAKLLTPRAYECRKSCSTASTVMGYDQCAGRAAEIGMCREMRGGGGGGCGVVGG